MTTATMPAATPTAKTAVALMDDSDHWAGPRRSQAVSGLWRPVTAAAEMVRRLSSHRTIPTARVTPMDLAIPVIPTFGTTGLRWLMAEPKYREIADDLRSRIESGEVAQGSQLPAETELMEQYNASRNTVRDEIKLLTTCGLVETHAGQATFVAEKIDPSQAEGIAADALRVRRGTQVVGRHQERSIDGIPWSLQTSFYPMDLVRQGAIRLAEATEGTFHYLANVIGVPQGRRQRHDRGAHAWRERDGVLQASHRRTDPGPGDLPCVIRRVRASSQQAPQAASHRLGEVKEVPRMRTVNSWTSALGCRWPRPGHCGRDG